MKKLFARLSLVGLFAGLAASSYAVPAAASVADRGAVYDGPTNSMVYEEVIIIVVTPDEVYWVEEYYYYGAVAKEASATPVLTDATFDR